MSVQPRVTLDESGKPKSLLLPYLPVTRSADPNFFHSATPLQFDLIDAAQSTVSPVAQDTTFDVLGRNYHAVQVSTAEGTTYNATVLVEGTLDGTNWSTEQTITQPGITQITGLFQSLRVSIPEYTSGTITVTGITQRS